MDELEALMTGGDALYYKAITRRLFFLAHIRAFVRRTGNPGLCRKAELECRGVS